MAMMSLVGNMTQYPAERCKRGIFEVKLIAFTKYLALQNMCILIADYKFCTSPGRRCLSDYSSTKLCSDCFRLMGVQNTINQHVRGMIQNNVDFRCSLYTTHSNAYKIT